VIRFKDAKAKVIDEFEKAYLLEMLKRFDGNISKMAKAIGINRKTIYRLMKHHGISIDKSSDQDE